MTLHTLQLNLSANHRMHRYKFRIFKENEEENKYQQVYKRTANCGIQRNAVKAKK